jgi:hypothetical protein
MIPRALRPLEIGVNPGTPRCLNLADGFLVEACGTKCGGIVLQDLAGISIELLQQPGQAGSRRYEAMVKL